MSALAEDRPHMARERYTAYLTTGEYRRKKLEADCWSAAFFWPLTENTAWAPTYGEFQRLRDEGPEALPPEALKQIEVLAEQYRFFHWHLEFPDVFSQTLEVSETSRVSSGGLDVVLGNPPWEMINLMEKEFFADRAPEVANARTGAARKGLIETLASTDPLLYAEYIQALQAAESLAHYLQHSRRFPLASGGRINTYAVFAELARHLLASRGRAGIVVPTGIATDYTCRDFSADLVESGQLASLYDFENHEGLFPGTHRSYKFALLTLTGGGVAEPEFAFFLHTASDLADPERRFPLSREDLALINPNTRTVPVFRTRRDAELTRKLYRAAPVLVNEEAGKNPWGVSLKQGLYNMTSDSHLFRTREQLEAEGFVLEGDRFVRGEETYLPLYEGRLGYQFNHRFATQPSGIIRDVTSDELKQPDFFVEPQYYVLSIEAYRRLERHVPHCRTGMLGHRRVSNNTNERTAIACILPWIAASYGWILSLGPDASGLCLLCANYDSFVFDYLLRNQLSQPSVPQSTYQQLPAVPPSCYTSALLNFTVPRVVELTYTAWDLQAFAQEILDEVGPETWARWFADAPVHTSPPPA